MRVSGQLLLKYAGDITEESDRVETDLHGGAKEGVGKFNWRFVWPVDLPCKIPRMKLQVWDANLIGSNDALGETNVSLKGHLNKAFKAQRKLGDRFYGVVYRDQWLTFRNPNIEGPVGRVKIRMDIVHANVAQKYPVGAGRDEPNRMPKLIKPKGRGAARWQVGKRFGKFLGNKFGGMGNKIAMLVCCLLVLGVVAVVVYFKFLAPQPAPAPAARRLL
mmetsp:Transcript_5302/g.11686  ORF Transcript_5302/g.11686 Transcript_5302/m.11686 type:complete len:218 (+) Transcript_5302:1-654(+)